MTTINFSTVQDITVSINAEYQGIAYPWDGKTAKAHFLCTIEANGEEFTTDYYCQYGKTCLESSEAAGVLDCILSDASICDGYDLDEFAREFCDLNTQKISDIINTYNACNEEREALARLGLLDSIAELQEAIDGEDYETTEE